MVNISSKRFVRWIDQTDSVEGNVIYESPHEAQSGFPKVNLDGEGDPPDIMEVV